MPYLETESGINLYYEDFGEGEPILFTHAGLATHKMWEYQVAKLAGDFRTRSWYRSIVSSSRLKRAATSAWLA